MHKLSPSVITFNPLKMYVVCVSTETMPSASTLILPYMGRVQASAF